MNLCYIHKNYSDPEDEELIRYVMPALRMYVWGHITLWKEIRKAKIENVVNSEAMLTLCCQMFLIVIINF